MDEVYTKYPGKTVFIVSHGIPTDILTEYITDKKTQKKSRNAETQTFILDVANRQQLNLHKPYIDSIKLQSPNTGAPLTRIPEVLDVWMDSGSMPYAQVHFPFAGFEDTSIRKAETNEEKTENFDFFMKMWKEEFDIDFHNRPNKTYKEIRDDFFESQTFFIEE